MPSILLGQVQREYERRDKILAEVPVGDICSLLFPFWFHLLPSPPSHSAILPSLILPTPVQTDGLSLLLQVATCDSGSLKLLPFMVVALKLCSAIIKGCIDLIKIRMLICLFSFDCLLLIQLLYAAVLKNIHGSYGVWSALLSHAQSFNVNESFLRAIEEREKRRKRENWK